ncbi:NucA/NucB deoxyribonuclease domain-containing protein [Nonomuraea sp. NPDC005692]|uniref:NucA/NucB deoxyribonuclease domain-containing protein n=1 Tax=Nonomuraea sp. NPDC005692 TaxID=3157168 RepID=UPI0033E6A002
MPTKYPPYPANDTPPVASGINCDEYPFASTKQGAGYVKGHYSVRAVRATQNRAHGNALSAFYSSYRVGPRNPFWIKIEP